MEMLQVKEILEETLAKGRSSVTRTLGWQVEDFGYSAVTWHLAICEGKLVGVETDKSFLLGLPDGSSLPEGCDDLERFVEAANNLAVRLYRLPGIEDLEFTWGV